MSTKYVGFGLRFVGWLIDMIVLSLAFSLMGIALVFFNIAAEVFTSVVGDVGAQYLLGIIGSVPNIIIAWLYYALMECSSSQGTLGKMVIGAKVVTVKGEKISFGRATGHFFGRILFWPTLGISHSMAGFTKKKQTMFDLISDTVVIKE